MNILICEDERLIALDLSASIKKMGYNVIGICHSGSDLIENAKKYLPDLILTDISLPGDLSGIDTIRIIKTWRYIPFIYISGLKDEKTYNLAMETEPCAFISKPFNYKELENQIEDCLMSFKKQKKPFFNL